MHVGLCACERTHARAGVCLSRGVCLASACMHVCVCTGREPRHYLNGSHFRVCRHFSEAAISVQTDTYTDRQTRVGGRGGGGGGGRSGHSPGLLHTRLCPA